MLDIFLTKSPLLHYPLKKWPKWDYVKRVLLRELDRITEYYQGRSKHVNNNHILSRLVKFLTPDTNLPVSDFFRIVDDTGSNVVRQFDFVTNSWKGKVLNNIFYKDEKVIFLYSSDDFNIFEVANKWKSLSPIRLIYTNEQIIDYYQFDNTKQNTYTTINVLEVNVSLMLVMYKYWAKERIKNEESTNANFFIAQIILPNMAKTSIDIILFNRFHNLYYNNIITTSSEEMYMTRHPFHVIDLHRIIDSIYKDVIDKVKYNSIPIEQLLLTIPTIYQSNMIDVLFINLPYATRQSEWVIWVSRIKYISFILDILGDKGITRNKPMLNSLPSYIRMLKNRSTDIESQLPQEMLNDIEYHIEKISNILGRR